jgi:branched-chain amino acid transport system substrate-binding protein
MLRKQVIALGAIVGVCLGSSVAQAKEPMEIGMDVALTGFLANFDGQFVSGAKLATQILNDAGGADGHQFNLHILDDASNATAGMTGANQLLNQFNVVAMLNGLSSAQNAAIEPVLARAKVPMIIFSVLPPDPVWAFQANVPSERASDVQFQFATQQLHAKKLAVVYSQTPYGQNNSKRLAELAAKGNVQIVYSDAVEGSATDMAPQMGKIKDAGADAVIDVLTGSTHIVEAKAASTVGLTAPLIMAADDTPTYIKATEAYPRIYFTASPSQAYPNIPNPALKAAYENFLAHFNKAGLDPAIISGASFGWDAVQILATAVKNSGATSGDALKAALERVSVQGTNTLYNFSAKDHSGQDEVPTAIQIGQMQNGKVNIVYTPK